MAQWFEIKSERDFHFSSTCIFTCFLWDIHISINFSNSKKMIRENTKGLLSFSSSELIETYSEWQSSIYCNTSTHFPINCLSKSERKLIAQYTSYCIAVFTVRINQFQIGIYFSWYQIPHSFSGQKEWIQAPTYFNKWHGLETTKIGHALILNGKSN